MKPAGERQGSNRELARSDLGLFHVCLQQQSEENTAQEEGEESMKMKMKINMKIERRMKPIIE